MMAVEDIASALPITAADAGLWPSQEAMIASAAADTTTCNAPRPNTSLRIPMRRFHYNSSAIMNKRNATPNSAMGAICPTSVMETAESQDTSLARAPRPNGPRTRCDGRKYSSVCALRPQSFGTARHIGKRPGGCETNGTPSVHPWAFLLGGIHGRTGSHWPGPDNIAAVRSCTDDRSRCGQARPHGLGSWHRFRLPGRNTGACGAEGLYC